MDPVSFKIFFYLIAFNLLSILAPAQKIMFIDDTLKLYSEALTVKVKGGTMLKFDFGPYTTIELKAGIATSSTSFRWRFLKDDISRSKSRQKFNFIIAGNQGDTARVKVAVKSDAETAFEKSLVVTPGYAGIESSPSLMHVSTDFIADISLSTDTAMWSLLITTQKQKDDPTSIGIILTDGKSQIHIKEVFTWNDGKSSLLNYAIGYNFLLNGKSIAAVQSSVNRLHKKLVWLRNDLDENMKLAIAAAAAALMEYNFLSSLQLEEFTDDADR